MKTKKLTFIESLMLVAGAGIGTGILTIPYAIEKIGIFGTITALLVAYVVSVFIYLVIADLTKNSKKSEDLMGILDEHLFKGKAKKILNIVFFILLTIFINKYVDKWLVSNEYVSIIIEIESRPNGLPLVVLDHSVTCSGQTEWFFVYHKNAFLLALK